MAAQTMRRASCEPWTPRLAADQRQSRDHRQRNIHNIADMDATEGREAMIKIIVLLLIFASYGHASKGTEWMLMLAMALIIVGL